VDRSRRSWSLRRHGVVRFGSNGVLGLQRQQLDRNLLGRLVHTHRRRVDRRFLLGDRAPHIPRAVLTERGSVIIRSYEQRKADYEQERWKYDHPFRSLVGEVLEELPILYFFIGWLSFFLLLSNNSVVFCFGLVAFVIWLAEVGFVMSEAD